MGRMRRDREAPGAGFYDKRFKRVVTEEDEESFAWRRERYGAVVPHIVGSSVLDLGCGLGLIAAQIDGRDYVGVDFSDYAVRYCKRFTKNTNARFEHADLRTWRPSRQFDTVLLLEVLEHVDKPTEVAKLALEYAKMRVVASVPREMPGSAHVWPKWTPADLERMLGKLTACELFGGKDNDRWWLAVKDIENA